jgi:hypothetical protein
MRRERVVMQSNYVAVIMDTSDELLIGLDGIIGTIIMKST